MNFLVDTSIWSLALRRDKLKDPDLIGELSKLIQEIRVLIIGPIRQELLSGVKTENQFLQLKSYLSAFPDFPLVTQDYEKAAEFFNICRRNGIQGSNTDFLICAVAYQNELEIFTSDQDFLEFQKCLPIKLHVSRST